MNEENEQSNEPVESDETTESNEPSTIADVATKFNVEQQATEFQTQSAPESPEPVYDTYEQETQQLVSELKSLRDDVGAMKQAATDDRLNRDVKAAVSEITQKVNLPGDNPDLMAEIYLEKMYREDKDFKTIFDNRYANPNAMKASMQVIANDIAKDFNIQVNDQLVENVRAAKKSQSTTATAPADQSKTDQMMGMNDGDFWNELQRIKG